MDEAAEAIFAHQFAARHHPQRSRGPGQSLVEPLMRPGPMVVLDESGEHALQVASAEDQEVVQTLLAGSAYEPLGDGVGPRGTVGEAHDLHALGAEDLIECGGELGVAIMEQELRREGAVLELPGQVPRLLGHPLGGRVVGAAGEVDAAAADLDEEEDVELGHADRIDDEEVAGQHLVGVLADEGLPAALASPRCRAEVMATEDPEHGQVGAAHTELDDFALDAAVAPSWVLSRESNDGLAEQVTVAGSLPAWPRSIRRPASADQLAVPTQQSLGAGEQR